MLVFLPGIGILAVVKSLYALIAAGLDVARIAFSKSKIEKKAVSSAAAAVVGVGLLCSPIESVQGQSNPAPPAVSSVTLTQDEASDSDWTSKFSISVRLDIGGSGWCVYIPGTGICSIGHGSLWAIFDDLQTSGSFDTDHGYFGGFSAGGFSAHAGGGYYRVKMFPRDHSTTSWIELWIYVNPLTGSVDAWVESDSAGNSYSVSISVN